MSGAVYLHDPSEYPVKNSKMYRTSSIMSPAGNYNNNLLSVNEGRLAGTSTISQTSHRED